MPNGTEEIVDVGSNDQEQVVETKTDAKSNDSRIAELEAELERVKTNLQAARRFEKESKQSKAELEAQLKDQEDWKTKYEQAELKLKNQALDGALTEAAKAAKAKDIKAVLKLIDRSGIEVKDGVADAKAVEAAIDATRKEFGLLFEQVELPPTGRAAEGAVTGDYQREIYAAKSEKEIMAVMKKYNKV